MLCRTALRSFSSSAPRGTLATVYRAPFSTAHFYNKDRGYSKPSAKITSHTRAGTSRTNTPHSSKVAEFPTPPSLEDSSPSTATQHNDDREQGDLAKAQVGFGTESQPSRYTEANSSQQSARSEPDHRGRDVGADTESSEHAQASPISDGGAGSHHSGDVETNRADASEGENQAFDTLPDLTKGIPSTLDAELERSQRASSSSPSSSGETEADIDPNEVTRQGGAKGRELPKTAYVTSQDRKKERLANWIGGILLGTALGSIIFSGRNWASEEEERAHPEAPNGWGIMLFYNRVKARIFDTTDYFNEPAFPKLLPTPDPSWERPYTLVLSLEDLLVHSEWSREHGWRMAKRPGVDYFLRYLSQYYEIVIFTSLPSMQGDAIIRKLDPYRIVMWPLFREATRYTGGQYVKVSTLLLVSRS